MKKILIAALTVFGIACASPRISTSLQTENVLSPQERDEGWALLFDGSSLDGWILKTPGTWMPVEGTLTQAEEGGMGAEGMIWTREKFEDFILQCEFKIEPGCNSGIFFRVGDIENPVQTGFEMQIIDSFARPINGSGATHSCGALYDIVPPVNNLANPAGEWNKALISCKGNIVSLSLNGDRVVAPVNLDLYTEPNTNIDGTKNKFNTPLKDFPRNGRIGFQQHGGKVWFRNIKIKII